MSARAPPASARATPPTSGGLPRELEPPAPQAQPRVHSCHRRVAKIRLTPCRPPRGWSPLTASQALDSGITPSGGSFDGSHSVPSDSRTRFGWNRGTSGPRWGPGTINLLPGQSGWGGGGGCRGRRRAARRKRGRSHSITSGWVCRAVRRELRRRRAIHLYHVRNAGCGWRRRPASPCAGRRGTLDWDVDMRDATIPRVTGNCGR